MGGWGGCKADDKLFIISSDTMFIVCRGFST